MAGLPLKVKCAHDDRKYTYTVSGKDDPRPFEVVAGPGHPETFQGLRRMHRIMPDAGDSLKTPETLEIKDSFGSEKLLRCSCQEIDWSNLWALRDLTCLLPQSTPLLPQGHAGAYVHAYPDIRWDIDLTFDLGALKYDYDDKKDTFDLKCIRMTGVCEARGRKYRNSRDRPFSISAARESTVPTGSRDTCQTFWADGSIHCGICINSP